MSKTLRIAILVVVLAVLVAGGVYLFTWKKGAREKKVGEPTWSVVYLSSGEIYVGKLQWSKKPQLDQGYLVMKVANEKDPKSSDIRLQPLAETVWAPTTLYLNADHILFHGPLSAESTVAKRLKEKGVL